MRPDGTREKCEIITRSGKWMEHLALQQFIPSAPKKACLLGAPLLPVEALTTCLEFRCSKLALAVSTLENITKHDVPILLRNALCSQKILHPLRSFLCYEHPLLEKYDETQRRGLSAILNINLNNTQWCQVSLPVNLGGLGIRWAASLVLPAFLLPLQVPALSSPP